MAQPVWVTDPGNLGTIEEGKFFQFPLRAYDPDLSNVYYLLIAGELPQGIRCGKSGLIEGIPTAVANLAGVPSEVGENVTSEFTVRVYTEKVINGVEIIDRINDRTFALTVAGQDIPEFITPPGQIASYFDGDYVDYQIQFSDNDPNDDVNVSLVNGELPPGVSLNKTGRLFGWIEPIASIGSGALAGWDRDDTLYDEFPWDFNSQTINKNYEFAVKITDGKESKIRTFSIYVFSRDSMTADNTDATADGTFITADTIITRNPYISNYSATLESVRHSNFYAYRYEGIDPDGERVRYTLLGGLLPAGLHLDEETGWMFGYIPNIGLQDITYSWTIRIAKRNNPLSYRDFAFQMTVFGNIDTDVIWISPEFLGTINNGEISTLSVIAKQTQNKTLQYRLKSGSNSKLPQGLKLLTSGNIIGRVSYETFSLDNGSTTFDKELRTRLVEDETTFDMVFNFTVEAYNIEEIINVSREFTIQMVRKFNEPCQCLRIQAHPPLDDRELIKQLVQNQDILKPTWLYRPDDPWFSVQEKIFYEHAYALKASNFSDYINAITTNHYWRNLILGEIKTARALDDNNNVLYEVVYSQIVDNLVNNQGISVSSKVNLKYPINKDDSTEISTVYPNSLDNMRDVIIDSIGQVSDVLPRWMLSKQENGKTLGFTPAWVIAYTQPGRSKQIAYKIEQEFGTKLNKIDFEIDRYIVDGQASTQWDVDLQKWIASSMTTFDRNNGIDNETIFDGRSTRFISNVNKHEYTDMYDKYILFPQIRITNNGE